MTLDLFEAVVGRITLELPDELFDKLNGGVIVQPCEKLHKMSVEGRPLYIAGEYTHTQAMRYVTIYYGSFMRLYGRMSDEAITERIREVMLHELRHHWESLAGERDLEIEDAEHIAAYIDAVREDAMRQTEARQAGGAAAQLKHDPEAALREERRLAERRPELADDAAKPGEEAPYKGSVPTGNYSGGTGWPEFTVTGFDLSPHTYGEGGTEEK